MVINHLRFAVMGVLSVSVARFVLVEVLRFTLFIFTCNIITRNECSMLMLHALTRLLLLGTAERGDIRLRFLSSFSPFTAVGRSL